MSNAPPVLIADSFVSLASLIGLFFLAQVLRRQQPRTELVRKFLFALIVLAALMATRLFQWLSGWDGIGRMTFLIAGLVPLATVLVAEALMRRHAPLALKAWVTGGATFCVVLAMLAGPSNARLALLGLAAFQAMTFLALAALVVTRDRSVLSPSENAMIDRLSVSLLLILPFALTDFRTDLLDAPVRLSGIAILALCWLALTLRQEDDRPRFWRPVLVYGACLLAAGYVIASLGNHEMRTTLQIMATLVSAVLVGAIFAQASAIERSDGQGKLLSSLANAELQDHDELLRVFRSCAPTSDAVVLDESHLGDFDEAFRAHFAQDPVVTTGTLEQLTNSHVKEQFTWFFRKYEASHGILVSVDPFRIMALNVPVLGQSKRLADELKVAQRMAVMLAELDTRRG